MKYGFSFKGIHTGAFGGLTVKTVSRPIKPEARSRWFAAPFADGAKSDADANPYGRIFYENRLFTVSMTLSRGNCDELNGSLVKISNWLTGSGELIFDDTPFVAWSASAFGSVDYAPERGGTKAALSVSFEVAPFGLLVWNAVDGPSLGYSPVRLGNSIPIGCGDMYTRVISEAQTEMSIVNYGQLPVRPVITICADETNTSPALGTFTVSDGKRSMRIYSASRTMIADCAAHTLTDADGVNIMEGGANRAGFTGEFLELPPGVNTITVKKESGAASGKVSVKVDFRAPFMWNEDFDSVEWR